MHFSDIGIIISKKKLKEHHCLVKIFSKNHGIYSGVLRNSVKKNTDALEGNLVDFTWKARLEEHVGCFTIDLVESYNVYIIMNKTKLYAFNAIINLIESTFLEREVQESLFIEFLDFLRHLRLKFCIKQYIILEMSILEAAGYKIQIDKCVVTHAKDNLYYLSPKSGCSVSKAIGEKYKDKLLKLPSFLLCNQNRDDRAEINIDEIQKAFKMTSYFFQRYIFTERTKVYPRTVFINHILD